MARAYVYVRGSNKEVLLEDLGALCQEGDVLPGLCVLNYMYNLFWSSDEHNEEEKALQRTWERRWLGESG